jgi:hypothetical protein
LLRARAPPPAPNSEDSSILIEAIAKVMVGRGWPAVQLDGTMADLRGDGCLNMLEPDAMQAWLDRQYKLPYEQVGRVCQRVRSLCARARGVLKDFGYG